jgi:DNA-binding transcriptional ArsR family regulator
LSNSRSDWSDVSAHVVDLSRPREPLAVQVVTSTASEVLVTALAASQEDPAEYDVGLDRIAQLRAAAGAATVRATLEVLGGDPKTLVHVMGHVVRAGEPYAVEDLLDRLREIDPDEVQLTLLGYHNRGARITDADTMRRAVAGDGEARAEVLAAAEEDDGDGGRISAILGRSSAETRAALVEVLGRWAEVFTGIRDEAMEPIERDAAAKRQLARRLDAAELIEVATNGVEFVAQPGTRRLFLLPSYVLRPWVILAEHDDVRVVVHPVADEHLELDRSTPPPHLVKLYKALGDESRLRLLRRLAQGPITLRQAAEEVGVAKSTAHHHLAVLRQAGLVLVRAEDDTTYSLREEELPRCNDLLARYLDPGSADAAAHGG